MPITTSHTPSIQRILNDEYELYEGLHDPIITQEQWDLAKAAQARRNNNPVNTDRQLRNPFAGILFCEKCGGRMKRNVPGANNPTPWYQCSTRGCDCKIMKCATLENAIRETMEDWLEDYMIHLETDQQPAVDPVETALNSIRTQLAGLQQQQEIICEYLEKRYLFH